jgi:hypothetical protein
MQAFVTEELIWALHRERVEDAPRVWLASRVPAKSSDDKPCNDGPSRWIPLNFRAANGR